VTYLELTGRLGYLYISPTMSFFWFVVLSVIAFGVGFWLTKQIQAPFSQPKGWSDPPPKPAKRTQIQARAATLESSDLNEHICQLMAQGKQMAAIKLVQQQNNWSLQEARFYVQQVAKSASLAEPVARSLSPTVQLQVQQLLDNHQKVTAIKLVRESTGWNLRQAKDYVENSF
jgi:ribosomal protein L7/L12